MTGGLEVYELSVQYGGVRALDEASFVVDPATIVGLIGPNGAGKTTAIDAISGFTAARGRVTLAGRALDSAPPHVRARSGLVRTFQSVELFDDLTVRQNVAVAASSVRWWSPFADAIRPGRQTPSEIDWALDAVGLSDLADDRPSELSHGRRRLIALARALASRPRVLLLDEPAAGLDTDETATLGSLVRSLPERGVAVLLVDHDMSLVMSVCQRVVVLDFGRVIAEGPPATIRHDRAVISAYLGTTPTGGNA